MEVTIVLIQIITVLILIGTLWVYFRQLQTLQSQLGAMCEAAIGQHLIALTTFLQAEDVRLAREHVLRTTKGKEYTDWDENDRRAAAKVCATYGPVGYIAKTSAVPLAPIVATWGPSIRDTYAVVIPFVKEMQQPDKGGPDYMSGFDWLHSKVTGSTR